MEKESKKRKGITLVETIVALALIVLISVSVLFACTFSVKTQKNKNIEIFFSGECENILMCYYHSDYSYSKFEDNFKFLSGADDVEKILNYKKDENESSTVLSIEILYNDDFSYAEKTSEDAVFLLTLSLEENKIICKSLVTNKILYEMEV